MKQIIFIIFSLVILFSFSCVKNNKNKILDECLEGHILFIHTGEENAPVEPFIIHTSKDSKWLQYKNKDWEDPLFFCFSRGLAYMESNEECVDSESFLQLRNILISSQTNNKKNENSSVGSFEIIIVTGCDSISFNMLSNKYNANTLSHIELVAQKNNFDNLTKAMDYYKKIQLQYNH